MDSKRLAGLRNIRSLRKQKAPGRMHCNAEPGKDESGVAAASGRGIYESVRTDHHEPLGQGGTGAQS